MRWVYKITARFGEATLNTWYESDQELDCVEALKFVESTMARWVHKYGDADSLSLTARRKR